METKKPQVITGSFDALDRSWFNRLKAQANAETPKERELIRLESERLNAVSYASISGPENNLSVKFNRQGSPTSQGTVAIIPVKGVLQKYSSGYWFRTVGTQEIRHHIREALAAPAVSAIVLNFDSGGGHVDGNWGFCEEIFQANKIKPVLGFVDGLADRKSVV